MALPKTFTASGSSITKPGTTPVQTVTFTHAGQPDVSDGQLVPSIHETNSGVFTAGTAPEGTISHTNNDSNS